MKLNVDDGAIELVARSSAGTPSDMVACLKDVQNYVNNKHPSERITADIAEAALKAIAPLRPGRQLTLPNYFVGQQGIRERIESAIGRLNQENKSPTHIILIGASGTGKTTLACMIAELVSKKKHGAVVHGDGRSMEKIADLIGLLTNVEDSGVIVIDNIDALRKELAECLESALVDFTFDVVIDEGPEARSVRVSLPSFTLVATATKKELLSPFTLASFKIIEQLSSYTPDELGRIVRMFAQAHGVTVDEPAVDIIVRSTDGTPKGIINLMRLVQVRAKVNATSGVISAEIASEALEILSSSVQRSDSTLGRIAIPSDVRREVWRRDNGKCVKCGSREKLEYDHIIPVAKGGSNTARNIELLCEICNRSKSASIQ